jgi:hypothetical protein
MMIASCIRGNCSRSMDSRYDVLDDAGRLGHDFIDSLSARPVRAQAG